MFSKGAAIRSAFLLILFALAPLGSAAAQSRDGEVVLYRVKKGDSLYELARTHFRNVSDFTVVQRLNRVADPYRLPVGRTLRIPRRLLRFERLSARIISFRGTVRILSRGEVPAAVGMQVTEGEEITTGPSSFVTLRVADESNVTLPSQSRVAIDRMRRWSLTGAVERRFRMLQGRARSVVTPLGSEDEFDFSTPAAVSAVRGTEFRVSWVDEAGRGTTEVLNGTVSVDGRESEQVVEAGFGAVSTKSGTALARLLPAPALAQPGAVQDEEKLVFELTPIEPAVAYRVQIAKDAGFLEMEAEATLGRPRVELAGVPDGTWFARVSAIDSVGLEGLYQTYAFERRLNRIKTSLEERRSGRFREYLFRWDVEGEGTRQFRFQLSRAGSSGAPLIDEPGLADQSLLVTDLPPGTYEWRVQTLQFIDGQVYAKWSPPERLTIADEK